MRVFKPALAHIEHRQLAAGQTGVVCGQRQSGDRRQHGWRGAQRPPTNHKQGGLRLRAASGSSAWKATFSRRSSSTRLLMRPTLASAS